MAFGLFTLFDFFCLFWVLPSALGFIVTVRVFSLYEGRGSDLFDKDDWGWITFVSVFYPVGLLCFCVGILFPWLGRVFTKKVF